MKKHAWFDTENEKEAAARLAKEATESVAPLAESHGWPGNLRELRAALDLSVRVARFDDRHSFLEDVSRLFAEQLRGSGAAEIESSQAARDCHQDLVRRMKEKGVQSHPMLTPFDDLPLDLKQICEELAWAGLQGNQELQELEKVEKALEKIDCAIREARAGSELHLYELSRHEIETLGRWEHSYWSWEKLLNGWRYGPGRNDKVNKTTPHLVPWYEFPKDLQKWDLDAAKQIPELLARNGLEVHRDVEAANRIHTPEALPDEDDQPVGQTQVSDRAGHGQKTAQTRGSAKAPKQWYAAKDRGMAGMDAVVECVSCGRQVVFDPGHGERPPEKCPKCGKEHAP